MSTTEGDSGSNNAVFTDKDGAYRLVAEAASGQTFKVGDPVKLSFDPLFLLDD